MVARAAFAPANLATDDGENKGDIEGTLVGEARERKPSRSIRFSCLANCTLLMGKTMLTLLLNALSLLREQPLKPFVFFLQFRCVHENINLRNSKRFHADSNFPKHLQKKSSASLAGGEACFEFEMEIAIEF